MRPRRLVLLRAGQRGGREVVPQNISVNCIVCWCKECCPVESVERRDESGTLEELEECRVVAVDVEEVDEGGCGWFPRCL